MLKLNNISKYYHSNEVVALGLRKVSLEFKLGEFVAVTGESGSGKSTLLNVISGLDTYEDGEMYVNEEETSYFSIEEWEAYRRQYIGFVFQNYNIIDSYSVLENVMVALQIQGYNPELRKERALYLIEKVGLSSHTHHKASKLSGGQKQRAVIARALAKDCPIIVCDEPTGNLDSESSKSILSLLQEISANKLVIVVTHNYDEIKDYATRKIRLFDGEVVEDEKIKRRNDVEESVTLAKYSMNLLTLSGIALRNLFRTPRRTIFTMIVAMFIAIIFTFSYGSYTTSTNAGIGWSGGGYFRNITDRRIVVTKFDDSIFTASELTTLSDLDRVNYILNHDVINDSYIYRYVVNDEYTYTDWLLINPAGALNQSDIKTGRLPESEFEVVLEASDEYAVGDDIVLGFEDVRYDMTGGAAIPNGETFEIVGILKNINPNSWENRIYLHDDYISRDSIATNAYLSAGWEGGYVRFSVSVDAGLGTIHTLEMYYNNFIIDDDLEDNKVLLSQDYLDELSYILDGVPYEENANFFQGIEIDINGVSNFYSKTTTLEIVGEFEYAPEEKAWQTFVMNRDTYNNLINLDVYQISVMVTDSYDANRVLDDLDGLGYNAIYPTSIGNQFDQIFQLFTKLLNGFLIFLLMIIIYFISYLVLRNVQNSKKKDYLIFRSIGASKKDLNKVTILELFFTMTLAFIVTMGLLVINEMFDTFIPQYLRFFTVGNYITIFLMLTVLALLLGNRFNKRIFSNSVITNLKQE